MKNHSFLAGFTLIITTLTGCCNETNIHHIENNEVAGCSSEDLANIELTEMERMAISGDSHAQSLVESYYLKINDLASYEEWLEKGASRHDPAAMQRFSSYLAGKGGEANCDKAIILLHKAQQLTPDRKTALRNVIDIDLRVLKGQAEGVPSCR